jgi:hypothetical protein
MRPDRQVAEAVRKRRVGKGERFHSRIGRCAPRPLLPLRLRDPPGQARRYSLQVGPQLLDELDISVVMKVPRVHPRDELLVNAGGHRLRGAAGAGHQQSAVGTGVLRAARKHRWPDRQARPRID